MVLQTQATRMNHSPTKPTFAPKEVVRISSPEPTMLPIRMKLGPRNLSVPRKVVGGSRTASGGRAYGLYSAGDSDKTGSPERDSIAPGSVRSPPPPPPQSGLGHLRRRSQSRAMIPTPAAGRVT